MGSGDWAQPIKDAIEYNKAMEVEGELTPRSDCPKCGWPLNTNCRGEQACPFGCYYSEIGG